jgi:hypothetical protein
MYGRGGAVEILVGLIGAGIGPSLSPATPDADRMARHFVELVEAETTGTGTTGTATTGTATTEDDRVASR